MLTKVCKKCGVEKDIFKFSKKSSSKDRLQPSCKECVKEYLVSYYLHNKLKAIKYANDYHAKNRDLILLKQSEYRSKNLDKLKVKQKTYRSSHKESIAIKKKEWQQSNKERVNGKNAKRRATKLQASPSWSDDTCIGGLYELAAVFNRTGINLHVDHIVPLISDEVCGLHCEANLQLLPANNNLSKGNRHWPDMW
jgi:hypothetical protein